MKKTFFVAFGAAIVVVSTIALFGGNPQQQSPAKVFLVETVTKRSSGKAVEFTWKDGGKSVSFLGHTKGKVVLLNLWATWCGPCKRELPDIVAISNEMAAQGVVVVGVSLDQKEDKLQLVKTFSERMNIPFVNVIDNLQISDAYGNIQSIPTTFIIDRNGNVVQRIVGMQTKQAFVAALQKVLATP